jgi:four helix bundle protein
MPVARSFRELNTYRLAREGARRVFTMSNEFPSEERYSLTDQVRRSSRAVTEILAEACGRRRYKAAFINKIDEAVAEAYETQAWLDDSLDCGYISPVTHKELDALYCQIAAKLNAMINKADDFCKNRSDHNYMQEERASCEIEIEEL